MERVSGQLSSQTFFASFLLPNKPCLIGSEITAGWKARREWVKNEKPNLEFLLQNFGNCIVPVADCSKEKFGFHPKVEIFLREYLSQWKDKPLYLKDWHFSRNYPNYGAYETPPHFIDDWMNEFWEKYGKDDFRFVYMGPKGTWTPFHADVYRSYSWSANVCGAKRWIIYPPGEEDYLRDTFGNLPFDVTSDAVSDSTRYPNAHKASKPIDIIQNSGEIIFIPSGWHHQVENVEDTISINHNWGNACNLDIMLEKLRSDLKQVKRVIADCEDMEGWDNHCQKILLADSGIDYHLFLRYLLSVSERILQEISEETQLFGRFVPRVEDVECALRMTKFGPTRDCIQPGGTLSVASNPLSLFKQFECTRIQNVLRQLLSDDPTKVIFTQKEVEKIIEIDSQLSTHLLRNIKNKT